MKTNNLNIYSTNLITFIYIMTGIIPVFYYDAEQNKVYGTYLNKNLGLVKATIELYKDSNTTVNIHTYNHTKRLMQEKMKEEKAKWQS